MRRAACSSILLLIAGIAPAFLSGCYRLRSSQGGGEATFAPPRVVRPADVALPAGYRIDVVATGLDFPTGVAFDAQGRPHVLEAGYSYGEVWTEPRLLRIDSGGAAAVVAFGGRNGPWTGVSYAGGAFYIAEGGQLEGGKILRVAPGKPARALVENLPSLGDHHVNGALAGSDGWVYFGVGTATNSGVVGPDNYEFGWLKRNPGFQDIPCRDIILNGRNFEAPDVLDGKGGSTTGAFSPFGTATTARRKIAGRFPCGGAVMRVPAAGGEAELVAWGFRNPFGFAFAPGGALYVTDNAYDSRGSRPVWGAADLLWKVERGFWHGWPDFSGDRPLGEEFKPPGKPSPRFLLAEHPNPPPRPAARLDVHASANGLDFSRAAAFGHVGQAFIALFGDQTPVTGKTWKPSGFKVVRVHPGTGVIEDFAVNKGKTGGPASKIGSGGLERPVAARFSPDGSALYVVDFGVFRVEGKRSLPQRNTGVLWRITREGSP